MSVLKYIWLSISRRMSKSIVLFLIIFILGIVLCASFTISNSMYNLENSFKERLGLVINIEKHDQNYFYREYDIIKNDLELLQNKINQLKKDEYLLYNDFQYILSGFKSDFLMFNNKYYENYNVDNISLIGLSETQFIDQVENKIKIVKGRYFTDEELKNGERVIILSDCFRYNNDKIEIGDKIQLKREFFKQDIQTENLDFTVIGIYKKVADNINTDSYNLLNYDTHIYIPLTTMINEYKLISNYYNLYPKMFRSFSLELNEIKIKVANVNYEEFVYKRLEKYISLLNNNEGAMYQLNSSTNLYEKIAEPLSLISKIAKILIYVSFISICVLSSLCIFLFLKDRKYEIAILYSMGQNKLRILMNQFLEIYIICLLSISLSLISGHQIAKLYSNYMVENQIKSIEYQLIEDDYKQNLIDDYEVKFDLHYLNKVYISISLISVVCSILPTMVILKIKPRKILM